MKAIVNGRFIAPGGVCEGGALVFGEKIIGFGDPCDCEVIDARGGYVTPGLIDLHIHGYLGADVSDGSADGIATIAEGIARNGVTSFLPTTMTQTADVISKAFDCVRAYMKKPSATGARALGCNMEGPYLSAAKKGAHQEKLLTDPDTGFILANRDVIRLVTIAPERKGALECIREVTRAGVKVAVGHTNVGYDEALAAIDAGATQATHTFNAMPTLGHREPGATGALIGDDGVYCELIADTFHVHKSFFKLLRRVKGDKLVLITDCLRAGGKSDGVYELGGQEMTVRGIECRLADGTIAGSVLTLNKAVKNMIDFGGAELCEAVRMATANPAMAIGVFDRKGSLETGKDADIAIFDEAFNAVAAISNGEILYERA